MGWNNQIYEMVNEGDVLYTPGQGLDGGQKRKPFQIVHKNRQRIILESGKSLIPIEMRCFDVVEDAFNKNPSLSLRVASRHDNEPFENSADKIIRDATGSDLARGNYVCAILERCGLVRYSMQVNKKVIVLP